MMSANAEPSVNPGAWEPPADGPATLEQRYAASTAGKPAVKYIPAEVLLQMGKVFAFGADKHAPFGWREMNMSHLELYGKAMRHMLQWASGHDEDEETHASHLAHALCDLSMLLDLVLAGKGKDDR